MASLSTCNDTVVCNSHLCFHLLITLEILRFRLLLYTLIFVNALYIMSPLWFVNVLLLPYAAPFQHVAWLGLDWRYALARTEHKETDATTLMIMNHHASGMAWCIMLCNRYKHSVNRNWHTNLSYALTNTMTKTSNISSSGRFTRNKVTDAAHYTNTAKLSTIMIMSRVLKVLIKSMSRIVMPQKQMGYVLHHITKFMYLYEK
jgi:hypothetical protein